MSPGPFLELFALLGAIYAAECVRSVGPACVAVRSLVPGQWGVLRGWRASARWRRALVFTAPWPPLGALFVTDALPMLPGPDGLVVGASTDQGWTLPDASAVLVPWSEANRLEIRERQVFLDGRWVATLSSRRAAAAIAELKDRVARASNRRRAELVERFLKSRFDVDEASRRRANWRRGAWPIVAACNLEFLAVSGVLALVALSSGERLVPSLLAAGAMHVIAWAVVQTWTTWRIPPHARPSVGSRVVSFVSPLTLVRSADELCAETMGDLDALAVAAVHLRPEELRALGRRTLAELTWPLAPEGDPAAEPVARGAEWLRERLVGRVRDVLRAQSLDPDALLRNGITLSPGGRAYCPRCLTEYADPPASCASCRGVRPISAAAASR